MFLHKKPEQTFTKKYTHVTGIVINSINSSLKIVIISQNLTERRYQIRKKNMQVNKWLQHVLKTGEGKKRLFGASEWVCTDGVSNRNKIY